MEEGRVLKWGREGLNARVPLNDFVSYMMFDGQSHTLRFIGKKEKRKKRCNFV